VARNASHRKAADRTRPYDKIIVRGAREHNLKNIDVSLPKNKLVVITGVSGSGKSSLAFDTIFAEGQRRYVESLSAYARQFIGQMQKPRYETIRGLSPTISVDQKTASTNPRSTVGTITEIYDYLRVLYARIGVQHCLNCGKPVGRGNAESMVAQIQLLPPGTKLLLLAPIVENRKGEHRELFERLRRDGFARVRIDGIVNDLSVVQRLSKHKKHTVEVVIDRLIIKAETAFRKRLTDSVELALRFGNGQMIMHVLGAEDVRMSEARACCGIAYPELQPQLFSFNSPLGMCPGCNGLGTVLSMDERKIVPDTSLSIREGAVVPWRRYFNGPTVRKGSWGLQQLKALRRKWKIDFDRPWRRLPKKHRDLLLRGADKDQITVNWRSAKIKGEVTTRYEGLLNAMMRRYLQTRSENAKAYYAQFMGQQVCQTCSGRRLKPEALHVRVGERSIMDLCELAVRECHAFFQSLELKGNRQLIAGEVLKEIDSRLGFMVDVGLDYLSLSRKGPTLSGGESQRIRLASQIGSELTGVLYILDEPTVGLHQKDNVRLLRTLLHLRDIGNTLLIVEHDRETIETADWIIDMGPGAGELGGQVVAAGTPAGLRRNPKSLTGKYLSGRSRIEVPGRRRVARISSSRRLRIEKAAENNLDGITVDIPLGALVTVTGVSGAGKSTLINQILFPALSRKLHGTHLPVGRHKRVRGLDRIDKAINIDQKPIGRTPRSNPATYTKVMGAIREVFARLPESRARGYQKGRFSFNVKGGRCEACRGDGYNRIEMLFLADVYVPCEVCRGRRYNRATLEIRYKGYSIADVLDMSVSETLALFANYPSIRRILQTLEQVGLAYIRLGQSATTLSGGEAQRIKLARELSKRQTGKTLYILDEPTTGLHMDDVRKLLVVLQELVGAGNTVIVIEHNLDVIKTADWIIDLGPEGGNRGGQVVAAGTPEQVAQSPHSYTGKYLKQML
jgi:excinuclease ABC subunit A